MTADPNQYTVGWICALPIEYAAATALLDETYSHHVPKPFNDSNNYTLGRIGRHRIVIAVLPSGVWGTTSAANVAKDMARTFRNVLTALVVGIADGAPSARQDIRLGDVVVASPGGGHGGVLQQGFGKLHQDEGLERSGFLNMPNTTLLTAVTTLRGRHINDGHNIRQTIAEATDKFPRRKRGFAKPHTPDWLFPSDFRHKGSKHMPCLGTCSADQAMPRRVRVDDEDDPAIHYGLVASDNQLMQDASIRDKTARELDVLCFETEAAGLMNSGLGVLTVRGICGYADTHTNDAWRPYAAMNAAAYAKELLQCIAPEEIETEQNLSSKVAELYGEVKELVDLSKKIAKSVHRDKLRAWLKPLDSTPIMEEARKRRHPDSCEWFIKGETFQRWIAQGQSPMWINGKSGCGKTVLSSSVIRCLQDTATLQPSLVLYFFFTFSDNKKQSLESAARTLLFYLCLERPDVEALVFKSLEQIEQAGHRPSPETLIDMLLDMISLCHDQRVFILLDGLDESPDSTNYTWDGASKSVGRSEILDGIRALAQARMAHVRLLVTSRPKRDIAEVMQELAQVRHIVVLKNVNIARDIAAYVQDTVRLGSGFKRWRRFPDVQRQIVDAVITKANGM